VKIPGSKRRWLALGVVALSVLVIIRWQDRTGPFYSYQLVDERTIAVDVFAPDVGWTRVTGVVESPTEVIITVSTIEFQLGPGFAKEHQAALTVTLKDPLGSRAVIDAWSGDTVRPLDCAMAPSDWGWCAGWSPSPAPATPSV
jgi:hypothetical protein